jgi:hypothetical protein
MYRVNTTHHRTTEYVGPLAHSRLDAGTLVMAMTAFELA